MNPARRPAPRFQLPIGTLVAVAIVPLLFLLLSWSSVANLLEFTSRQESARSGADGAARRWAFDRADALVLPGSAGLDQASFDPRGLSLTLTDGEVDLSLRMRDRPVALGALDGATVSLSGDTPVSVWLIATTRDGIEQAAIATHVTAMGETRMRLHVPTTPADQPAHSLRMHLSTTPGASLQLHSLDLHARSAPRAVPCAANDSVPATLLECGTGPGIIQLPVRLLPGQLLAFADELRARSLATIQMRGSSSAVQRLLEVAASRSFALVLTALALLTGLLLTASRIRTREPPASSASAWGLALLLIPLTLLWLGIPRQPPEPALVPLAAWFAVLLLLPRTTHAWQWLGHRDAWIATLRFCVAAAIVIATLVGGSVLAGNEPNVRAADLDKLWIYPLWAAVQQYLLIAVIGPRTRAATASTPTAAILAGTVFGLLHLPNFSLMLFTFVAGSAWAWQGYRHRALLPLIVSHAALGALLMLSAPAWLLRSAEIGGRFLMPP